MGDRETESHCQRPLQMRDLQRTLQLGRGVWASLEGFPEVGVFELSSEG